jgi:hypothetical protein
METPQPRDSEPSTSLVTTPKGALTPAPPLIAHATEVVGALSKQRKLAALLIAAVSDGISLFAELIPPLEWALDVATAIALFAVLGWRWQLVPVLLVEAVPGLAAFPTWVLVVGVIAGTTPTK